MTLMRPLKSLIGIKEAYELLWPEVQPVQRVKVVPLLEAAGAVLAEEVVADLDVPPFSRAAMDGYAVKAEDTFGASGLKPRFFNLVEVIHAGEVAEKEIASGQCIQVGTGAPKPKGADAVLMVEDTERDGQQVKTYRPVYPGANIMERGADIAAGQKIISKETYLNPSIIGVLAALGRAQVKVYDKPRVAVVPSGNEIRSPGKSLGPGEIYDVNSYTLAALVREHGGQPMIYDVLPDNSGEIKESLLKALADCDLAVLSGGSSAGERDVMVDALPELGRLIFHGIAVKPGKPTMAAVISEKLVLVMPGYPTSCLTNAYVLLVPMLRKMAHLPEVVPHKVKGVLSRKVISTVGRYQLLTVRVKDGEIEPAFKESGAITSMALAHGYVEIPENVDLVDKGETVEVTLF